MTYRTNKNIKNLKFKIQNSNQSGVTLLLSILVLSAILAIAFSLATVTFVEVRSSGDLTRTEPTYYAADAISEEALYKVKRNVPDSVFNYDVSLNNVSLTVPPASFTSTPLFQAVVPKTSYDFTSTKSRFLLFDPACPAPSSEQGLPTNCPSGGSGYSRIKVTYLDTGNTANLIAYLCEFDPRKGVDPNGTDSSTYRTVPCSDPTDIQSNYWLVNADSISAPGSTNFRDSSPICSGYSSNCWVSIDPNKQQELILYNNASNENMYVQIETYDQSNTPKGMPLVGSKALDISASSFGIVRKIRTTIPTSNGSSASASGYAHNRQITINNGQVSSGPLTDFPVLINITDPTIQASLQSSVTSAQGYDIMFAANSDGSSPLKSEIEKYDNTTGALVAWVKVPSLNNGSSFYMFYGKSGVSSPPNAVSDVWDGNYKGVYHLNQISSGTSPDSSLNNNTLNYGPGNICCGFGPSPTADSSTQIGSGIRFNATNQYYGGSATTTSNLGLGTGPRTISAWVKPITIFSTDGNQAGFLQTPGSSGIDSMSIYVTDSGGLRMSTQNTSWQATIIGSSNVATNNWYYITGVWDGSSIKLYLNGSLDSTGSLSGALSESKGQISNINRFLVFSADEIRFSNLNRPGNWIQTEYNNQSSPVNFYTVGAEQ